MIRPYKTWVEISKSALISNATTLKHAAGKGVALMGVLKANAYGHGLAESAMALTSAPLDWIGVDSLREAEVVRDALKKGKAAKRPILLLGYTQLNELERAVKLGVSMTVYNLATVTRLGKYATAKRPAKIHLKLETGTSRQGITADDVSAFGKFMGRYPNVHVEGVSTHYANIEDTTDPSYAMDQLRRFKEMLAALADVGIKPKMVHSASSAATMLYPQTHFDMVRAGLALYGMWPSKETRVTVMRDAATAKQENARGALQFMLRPALTWKTIVAQVKSLPEGAPVSYGLTERVTRRSRVAVIPVGYWDGFDRKLSSIGYVLVHGKRAKVLGRVCMNIFVADVTDIPDVKIEDEVVLLGSQQGDTLTAEDMAAAIGTINYEVVTRINPLVPRVLVK